MSLIPRAAQAESACLTRLELLDIPKLLCTSERTPCDSPRALRTSGPGLLQTTQWNATGHSDRKRHLETGGGSKFIIASEYVPCYDESVHAWT